MTHITLRVVSPHGKRRAAPPAPDQVGRSVAHRACGKVTLYQVVESLHPE